MVDDSCLSPSNFHEMGKGGGGAAGGRVHSIDVILGFSKDQDPLLSPAGAPGPHKVGVEGLAEPGKQQEPSSHPSYGGHLSSMRDSGAEQQPYHGKSPNVLLMLVMLVALLCQWFPSLVSSMKEA